MLAQTNNLQHVSFDNDANGLYAFLNTFSKNPGLNYLFCQQTEIPDSRTKMLKQLIKQLSELPLIPSSFRLGVLSNVNYSERTHAILNDYCNNVSPAANPIVLIHTTSTFSDPKFDVKYYYHEILENTKVQVVQLTPYCKTEMVSILTNISKQNNLIIDEDIFSKIAEKSNGNASAAINMLQMFATTKKKPVSFPNNIMIEEQLSLFSPDFHRTIYSQIGKILYYNETKPKLDFSMIIAEVNADKTTLANSVYQNMPNFLTNIEEYAAIMQYFSLSENMRNRIFQLSCMPALYDNLDYIQFHISASAFLIFGKSKIPNKRQDIHLFDSKAENDVEIRRKTIFNAFSNLLEIPKKPKNVTENESSIENVFENIQMQEELEEPDEEEKDAEEIDDAEHNKQNENEDICQIQTQTSQKIFFAEIFPFIRDRQDNLSLSMQQKQLLASFPKMVFQNRSFKVPFSNNSNQQNSLNNVSKPSRKTRRRRRFYSKPNNGNHNDLNHPKNPKL